MPSPTSAAPHGPQLIDVMIVEDSRAMDEASQPFPNLTGLEARGGRRGDRRRDASAEENAPSRVEHDCCS